MGKILSVQIFMQKSYWLSLESTWRDCNVVYLLNCELLELCKVHSAHQWNLYIFLVMFPSKFMRDGNTDRMVE